MTTKKDVVSQAEDVVQSASSTSKDLPEVSKVDMIIESAKKQQEYQKIYNQRPDVKARQKAYMKKRNDSQKVANRMMSGEITKEEANAEIEKIDAEYQKLSSSLKKTS